MSADLFGSVPAPEPLFFLAQPAAVRAQRVSTPAQSRVRRNLSEHAVRIEYRSIDADTLHGRSLGRAYLHGAAGAAAHGARHELLERHLAGQPMTPRELRARLQHRRRSASEDLHLAKLGWTE